MKSMWPDQGSIQRPLDSQSDSVLCSLYGLCISEGLYEGQSINSDHGPISKTVLLESELFLTQNVDMGVAYSCLKYGVFIMNRFDVMRIWIQHCECSRPRISPFLTHFVWW